MVPLLAVGTVAGILASKHARTLAVVTVVAQTMGEEPLLVAVVVLVVEIDLQFLHAGLQQVEVPALGIGTGGADEFQLRVSGAEGGIELLQALGEDGTEAAVGLVVVPLLVADTEIFQVEGLGMAHVCAHLTPLAVDGAIGELYEVEGILDVTVEIIDGHVYAGLRGVWVLELAGQSATDDGQGLTAEVLAELEELEEAETIRLEIVGIETVAEGVVPAVLVQRTVLYGTHGVLPLVAGLEVGALYDTTAGETEYARVHVEECLRQILAHAVLTTFPRVGGEKGDMLHVGRGLVAGEEEAEGALGLGTRRLQRGRVFLPLLAADLDIDGGEALVLTHGVVVDETHLQCRSTALGTACPQGETVGGTFLDGDAEEALVLKTGELVAVAGVLEAHVMGIALEGTVVLDVEVAEGAPAHEVLGELKGAVLHHLGIEPTVGGIVDVFKEDAVHRRLYRGTELLRVDIHHMGLCRCSQTDSKQKKGKEFLHI